ncbi:MAG: hypothetical protein EB104_04690 [Acidimicrobiia bacterium]|nr:hypothetical protein [Acidimicrobiia bacterium]
MRIDQVNFHLLRDEAKQHVRRRDVLRLRNFRAAMGAQTSSQVADAMTSLGLAQVLLFDLNPGDTTQAFLRGLLVAAFKFTWSMRTLPAWRIPARLMMGFGKHSLNIHTVGKFTFRLLCVQPHSKS